MQNFEYNFNVNGNYSSAINNMSRATERQRLRGVVRRALWLEEMRMKNHAEILSRVLLALFGEQKRSL